MYAAIKYGSLSGIRKGKEKAFMGTLWADGPMAFFTA